MSRDSTVLTRTPFSHLMWGALMFLALLVVARFVLELGGVPQDVARYVSSSVGMLLVAIYVAAVAPIRGGLTRFSQLPLPALILAAWTEGWIILATLLAGVLRLTQSHFAEKEDYGNWSHLGRHVAGHLREIIIMGVVVLLLMTIVHTLWHWPITVAPGALLGMFVVVRFWTEAMGVETFRSAAWSSTVLVLVSAIYLGGVGARVGLTEARQLLVPSMVIGLAWRAWVYLATLFAAAVPFFHTHFFDRVIPNVPLRLLMLLVGSVTEGAMVGILVWAIATWIACVTCPAGKASTSPAE